MWVVAVDVGVGSFKGDADFVRHGWLSCGVVSGLSAGIRLDAGAGMASAGDGAGPRFPFHGGDPGISVIFSVGLPVTVSCAVMRQWPEPITFFENYRAISCQVASDAFRARIVRAGVVHWVRSMMLVSCLTAVLALSRCPGPSRLAATSRMWGWIIVSVGG